MYQIKRFKLALRILRVYKRYVFAFKAIQCNVQQRVVHGSHDGPGHGRYMYSCSRIEGYETIEGEVFHSVHSYIINIVHLTGAIKHV